MNSFQDAFISYGRADSKAFATKLYQRLIEAEFKIWFDQNDIPLGVDFQNQIDDGLEKSDNFLFIIAPHSVNSPYCGKEIELAIKRNKRIIPLLHVEQISR
ncbi:MAG: toll/interleukin-1 receptor domain-containing protein [Coleofasciculus sp. F4-SAH-05]